MTNDEIRDALARAMDHETWCNRDSADLDDDDLACVEQRLSVARTLVLAVRRLVVDIYVTATPVERAGWHGAAALHVLKSAAHDAREGPPHR